jgi:hypothetical protein
MAASRTQGIFVAPKYIEEIARFEFNSRIGSDNRSRVPYTLVTMSVTVLPTYKYRTGIQRIQPDLYRCGISTGTGTGITRKVCAPNAGRRSEAPHKELAS